VRERLSLGVKVRRARGLVRRLKALKSLREKLEVNMSGVGHLGREVVEEG